jgi:SAM-dependent methyltransferase
LICAACPHRIVREESDGFYSFQNEPPAQDRSLLVHMEAPRNRYLRQYSHKLNQTQLREVFSSFDCAAVLDIGCGAGQSWRYFTQPFRYYGLEPSPLPERLRRLEPPPAHVMLIRNDPSKPLPVAAASFTMATFLASYDHIPDRREILRQTWESLRIGGHMVFYMTNYGFWAKRFVNALMRRPAFKHEHEHYCVHSPESLTAEVTAECPGARLVDCRADYFWVPNTPFRLLYRSKLLLRALDLTAWIAVHGILRLRNAGAVMICVFEKRA